MTRRIYFSLFAWRWVLGAGAFLLSVHSKTIRFNPVSPGVAKLVLLKTKALIE